MTHEENKDALEEDAHEEKDAFARWMPVALLVAGIALVIGVGYEVFIMVETFF
jgi:hypothetical protein